MFKEFPKVPRMNREMVITEKIDGTNGAIHIVEDSYRELVAIPQSRNRLITPEKDNFGFAQWVWDNSAALIDTLGEGVHFGEWWGNGIQRGYGLPKGDRRFSLFNVRKWGDVDLSAVPGLNVVPVLHRGPFDTSIVNNAVRNLDAHGSFAAPGFPRPEGVIVFHEASNSMFKVTCEKDEVPKALAKG